MEEVNNVINLKTRQTVLPKKVRATLMGQYMESKANDNTPEQFIEFLEKRVLGDLAYEATRFVREAFNDITATKR